MEDLGRINRNFLFTCFTPCPSFSQSGLELAAARATFHPEDWGKVSEPRKRARKKPVDRVLWTSGHELLPPRCEGTLFFVKGYSEINGTLIPDTWVAFLIDGVIHHLKPQSGQALSEQDVAHYSFFAYYEIAKSGAALKKSKIIWDFSMPSSIGKTKACF